MTLQLEVGKTYLTREGKKVKLINTVNGEWHKFEGDRHYFYGASGGIFSDGTEDGADLVEEYVDDIAEARSKSCALSCIMAAVEAAQ